MTEIDVQSNATNHKENTGRKLERKRKEYDYDINVLQSIVLHI